MSAVLFVVRSWGAEAARLPLIVLGLFCLTLPRPAGASETSASPLPALAMPESGTHALAILSPTMLEFTAIVAGSPQTPPDGPIPPPPVPSLAAADFAVAVDGKPVSVETVGFRRRAIHAPLKQRDLRVGNFIALQLATPVPERATVELAYQGKVPFLAKLRLTARADPQRLSPAIHVNQIGYTPEGPKAAMVGYFLGTLRELELPAATAFEVLDVHSGKVAHRGALTLRPDKGFAYPWYRRVWEADFTALKTPGEYRLVVPGLGASYAFFIHEGAHAALARTHALGLYHQRCGAANALPFTRFVHDLCHHAPAEVPTGSVRKLKGLEETAADADLFPYVRKGKVDVSGGHHDAGDYSKYTTNSAALIHHLVFAADAFAGAGALDNLGLPESGDGKSDLLQIAKWEADFLAKMQDEDGGFYFLVYPRDRRYEGDVLPDKGDPQIVWPKNTAATAAAVAALAQCASSPKFRESYPDAARHYLAIAQRGWKFLLAAEQKHGRGEAYRKFTHYGDQFGDDDDIAWAACELFLATGEAEFERELQARLDPRDPKTHRYGWRRLTDSYGNAIRSYAFGARSGRVPATKLYRQFLVRCEDEIIACAEDWQRAARDSAYGVSFPEPTKRVAGGGWFFPADHAFDLAVAAQLEFPPMADRRPAFREAVISNFNYETGCNPVNVCFVTGLGWKRPLEIVHQYAQNDRRALPPGGIPLGAIQEGFSWVGTYKGELGAQSFPLDGAKDYPYPIMDRWGESFNLQTEFVVVNQARALATSAWLMAQSPLRDQPWKTVAAEITGAPKSPAPLGQPLTLKLTAAGLDLRDARIVWEARGQPPVFGHTEHAFTPRQSGPQWIEAEAQLPDGRRVFAIAEFSASAR